MCDPSVSCDSNHRVLRTNWHPMSQKKTQPDQPWSWWNHIAIPSIPHRTSLQVIKPQKNASEKGRKKRWLGSILSLGLFVQIQANNLDEVLDFLADTQQSSNSAKCSSANGTSENLSSLAIICFNVASRTFSTWSAIHTYVHICIVKTIMSYYFPWFHHHLMCLLEATNSTPSLPFHAVGKRPTCRVQWRWAQKLPRPRETNAALSSNFPTDVWVCSNIAF